MIKSCTSIKLGAIYNQRGTSFQVWAPDVVKVSLALYETAGDYNEDGQVTEHEGGNLHSMIRSSDGVWSTYVSGDMHGIYYMYKVESAQGAVRYTVDPYAVAVSANGCRGVIMNLRKSDPEGWDSDIRPSLPKATDAILYELHVRDFSIHEDSGMKYKGKYKAFTETGLRDPYGNSVGLNHLVELGITHVHLLPIFDFKTVNELSGMTSSPSSSEYNWGYDPQHYNVPEGSYATDPANPIARIREVKEMIQALHAHGIRVIMDVVYNHTYTVEDGPFETLAPGYFYRKDERGQLSNGSGVGNELATERPMVRKFIKDSLKYWAKEYRIDGFRFDLMALIDTTTMREIVTELRDEVEPTLLFYGEPWTGGNSPLAEQTVKGSQQNQAFAVFNDHFRHAIKGDNDGSGRGFATGESWCENAVVEGMMGSIHDFAYHASETVNYVTVHDNLNLWDKVIVSQGLREEAGFLEMQDGQLKYGGNVGEAVAASDPYGSMNEVDIMSSPILRRSLIANGIVLLSQGIPLLHAGDELLRTKYGDHNSYRSGDAVNAIRWAGKHRFKPVFDYYKGLIALRKAYSVFRLSKRDEIERQMEFLRCSDRIVACRLWHRDDHHDARQLMVIINANEHDVAVDLPPTPYRWNIIVNDRAAGTEPIGSTDGASVTVPALSMMVLYEDQTELKKGMVAIELEYERKDQAYDGWNAWVWGSGVQDGSVHLYTGDDGKARALIYAAAGVKRVGCILRLRDWEQREGEADRFIEIPEGQTYVSVLIRCGNDGAWSGNSDGQDVAS
ncbi:type I pullulanase [Paenibacillus sp. JCM 10914]